MFISSFCLIKNNTILLNGEEIFSGNDSSSSAFFLIDAYRALKIDYPKFFKMDNLSKLAFLSAEILLKNNKVLKENNNTKTGIVLLNSSSSLNVDAKFQDSMNDIASPSLFVYTLPNVMIGEICIKFKIFGENCALITDGFDIDQMIDFVDTVNEENIMDNFIAGYANFDENDAQSCLMFVENYSYENQFDNATIKKILNLI
jgi:hypothetical protein